MKLTSTMALICTMLAILVPNGTILRAQEPPRQYKTPFSYEFNLGGTAPVGQTADGPYNASFLIGGGASVPIGKWFTADLVSMDFGFGTTNKTQTVSVSDGTKRKTSNYQMSFSSGGHVNIPLGRRGAVLGLGGGYGAIVQNEYVPVRVTNNGVVTVIQTVNCSSVCSTASYQGSYVEARLFGRSDKHKGFGINAKYYMVNDPNPAKYSFVHVQPQRWLSVGIKYTFGI